MTPHLPAPLAAYFAAVNDHRYQDAAACFRANASVHDEDHDYRGSEEILGWIEDTCLKYSPKAEVRSVVDFGGKVIVTAEVSGNFPGSPAELDYSFSISREEITRLSIE
jgi:hypothetical protein